MKEKSNHKISECSCGEAAVYRIVYRPLGVPNRARLHDVVCDDCYKTAESEVFIIESEDIKED